MSHDTLSDVLRTVRLHGGVYYYVSCRTPWSAEGSGVHDIAAAVSGAEHVIAYHMLVKGDGWAAVSGLGPLRLRAGDVVMFPQGDVHVISSAPGLQPSHADFDWVYAARNQPMPMPIAYHSGVVQPGASMPVDSADTILLCGFIGCDLRPFNPLIASLPPVLHVPGAGTTGWVATVVDQAVKESREPRAGSDVLLARISEMFFVDAIRRYIESLPDPATGWLAALRDRHVGKAIGLLHQRSAESWTLEELGRQVGLSRSALHERFVELVGQPPMQYLANWRMQRGAVLLRDGDATVATIAQDVGYESEAAFARAFKRLVGQPPAAWRRAQRASIVV